MKKILFVITLLLLSISNVNAEACDAYDIKRLKEIADGVEITYELQEAIEYDGDIIKDIYQINIIGLTDEIFLYDVIEKKYYDSKSSLDFTIRSGLKKYQVKSACSVVLRTISLELPVYNNFYNSGHCEDERIKDLEVCEEWTEKLITETDIIKAKEDADSNKKNEEKINKRTIIIGTILLAVLIVGLIVFIVIKRKKEELK